jgi:hypothetical protein
VDPLSQEKTGQPSSSGPGRQEADSSGASREISRKIEELAVLLAEAESRTPGAPAKLFHDLAPKLTPTARAALARTFGGETSRALVKVILDACADRAGADGLEPSVRGDERISQEQLVALVEKLFRQFLRIEAAVVAVATDIVSAGNKLRLPGYVANLRGYVLQLIHNADSDAVDVIDQYLGDINNWIAACLLAWVEAPERWWAEWWGRLNPRTIEEKVQVGILKNKFQEYWKQFKEFSRDLAPPEAKAQILAIASRIAREKMQDRLR